MPRRHGVPWDAMTATPARGARPDLIDVEDFFADPQFADPSISPDGTRMAYLAPHRGRRNVWVRGVDQDHDAGRPGHARHPPRDQHLLLDRRSALAALPTGHRRRRGVAPAPSRPRPPGPAGRRPDAAGPGLTGVRRRPGDHGARHGDRLHEPPPAVRRRLPGRRGHRCDHTSRGADRSGGDLPARPRRPPELVRLPGRRGHPRDRGRGPRHRRAADRPPGRRPGAPDGRLPAAHPGRPRGTARRLPGLRRPAADPDRPRHRRADRGRRGRRATASTP